MLTSQGVDACTAVTSACSDSQNTVNFFEIYYCHFNHICVLVPLMLVAFLILFKFVAAVVEDFIVPGVVVLCKFFKLSDAFAGVTLIAFANGAGDVITSYVASSSPMIISYTIGALFGASLFVITVVIAITIISSPRRIIVHKANIFRDVTLYIVATMTVIYFGYRGEIRLIDIIAFISLYGVLILAVVVQDRIEKSKQELSKPVEEDDEEASLNSKSIVSRKSIHQQFLESAVSLAIVEETEQAKGIAHMLDFLDRPFKLLRTLTIPISNPLEYDRRSLVFWPVFGVPAIAWLMFPALLRWYVLLPIIVGLCLFFHFSLPNDEVPSYFVLIIATSILLSLAWSELVVSLILDMLTFIGVMLNLPFTYLGLTVIAIGNAITDSITVISMSAKGHAIIGITGGYAAQVFSLLVGFGIAILRRILSTGKPVAFPIFNPAMLEHFFLEIILIFVLLGVLLFTYIYAVIKHFRFHHRMAYILIAIYAGFFTCATVFAIYTAIATF